MVPQLHSEEPKPFLGDLSPWTGSREPESTYLANGLQRFRVVRLAWWDGAHTCICAGIRDSSCFSGPMLGSWFLAQSSDDHSLCSCPCHPLFTCFTSFACHCQGQCLILLCFILTFLLNLCVMFPHLLVLGALRSLVSDDGAVKGMRMLNHICLSKAPCSLSRSKGELVLQGSRCC